MTREQAIAMAEFEQLLINYGNLCFDCGAYDSSDVGDYDELNTQCTSAKQAVLDAYPEPNQFKDADNDAIAAEILRILQRKQMERKP